MGVSACFPVLIVVAMLIDAVRGLRSQTPWMSTRLLLFLLLYLYSECVGLVALAIAWLVAGVGQSRRHRLLAMTYNIQGQWVLFLLAAIKRLFSLRFELEGLDQASRGPLLVFVRHCSIIDTLLPTAFISMAYGMKLRFVLKRELLNDPCIDVAGSRLPNYFAARDGIDSASEIAAVSALAQNLSETEAVLLYPEGTRFSERKRERLLAKLKEKDPAGFARAEALKHVLPARLGGALALLQASDADVLFIAHQGLDGFASVSELFRGALVRRTVRVRVWRVARESIPMAAEAREQWLHQQWQRVDDTIGALKQCAD